MRNDLGRILDHVIAQVELDLLEVELAGLDLGEVQDVVDDCQERVRRSPDGLGVLALLVGQVGLEQRPVMPITPFMGVRISWLMLARNWLFARLDSTAKRSAVRRASSIEMRSNATLTLVA